jgi:tripartite-type tricarboxylate transporter receptor subunit TctC
VQIGLAKARDLPDVPLLMDLGTNEEDRQLLRVLSSSTHIGRPVFTTPEAPPERVAALRKAFDTMVHDPVFIEEARREKFDIEPTTGEAMQKVVTEMMAVPKAQSDRLKQIIE